MIKFCLLIQIEKHTVNISRQVKKNCLNEKEKIRGRGQSVENASVRENSGENMLGKVEDKLRMQSGID